MIGVLRDVRALLARDGNCFDSSSWDDTAHALRELDDYLAKLAAGGRPNQTSLGTLFAPTGPIQEVSVRSGWGEEFLVLADRFDRAEKELYR